MLHFPEILPLKIACFFDDYSLLGQEMEFRLKNVLFILVNYLLN